MTQHLEHLFPTNSLLPLLFRRSMLWTLIVAAFLGLGLYYNRRENLEIALGRAQDSFNKDVAYRTWATQRGGVYVPLDEKTPANPYLSHLPDREITTTTGKTYTLVNPAYMTRMVHEVGQDYGLRAHITSLRPIRPQNAPDEWERKALQIFETGRREFWEPVAQAGRPYLRYMGAFIVAEGCLRCHASQGYKVGEVRGGISVTVPLFTSLHPLRNLHELATFLGLVAVWVVGLGGIFWSGRREQAQAAEQRLTLLALQNSRETYQTLIETCPIPIAVHQQGCFVYANPAFLSVLGAGRLQELLGRPFLETVHPEFRSLVLERIRRAEQEGLAAAPLHETFLRLDGTPFEVEVRGFPIQLAGNPAILIFVEELTERHRLEEERRQLEHQLQQVQKLESLGSLAGGVAHDMNNVLGAILGLASAHLEIQPPESPAYRAFQTITKACVRGGTLVKGLLAFAHHDLLEAKALNLNELIQEEVQLLERTTLAQVQLEMDLDPDLRPILGDASALTHALMNLCVNAVDALPPNGRLILRTRNCGPAWVEAEVEDTGCGMPKEVLDKALDPFFTTKPQGKGTGLGLSLVYSTVKAHRGKLELRSEPGRGTHVILGFPAYQPAAPTPQPSEPARTQAAPRRLSILLVDDDELIRSSMTDLLETLGHTAAIASRGEEGLRLLAEGLHIDAVILDMNMPGLGGAATLPKLRELRPTVPILLATGRADQAALDLVQAHSGVTLLAKPFSLEELRRRLEELA